MWFWAHHVLCDGAAAVIFINNWLQVYRNLIANQEFGQRISRIDVSLLEKRNSLGIKSWKFIKQVPFQVFGLFGAVKFIFRDTTTTFDTSESESPPQQRNLPAILSIWINETEVRRLLSESARLKVSLNSILLGDLFRAFHQWRKCRCNDAKESDWLRIILPMNLREFADRGLPMANRTSLVQIDRRELSSVARDDLSRSIDREVKLIRRWRLDRMFLIFVRILSLFELNLRKAAANPKSRGIAVFTNLGRPIKNIPGPSSEPDLPALSRLLEFDFVGPIRLGTPFNFAVGRFRQGLRITLHYDSHIFSPEDAHQLLQIYRELMLTPVGHEASH